MRKKYCRGFYKIGYRLWYRGYRLRIFLLPIAFCLLPVFVNGCAGAKTARDDIKTLPWETYLLNKERQGRTEDTIIPPPQLHAYFWIAGSINLHLLYEPEEYSSPAVVDNKIYVGSADGYFYAIDLARGREIWEFSATGAVESSPTVADGRVYFGTNNGKLYCLDIADGREIWQFQAGAEIISSPVVEAGTVYFSSADDKLYALRAETGEKLWHYSRGYVKKVVRRVFASPALSGNNIYCSFTDGYIAAIEKSSGREIWKKKVVNSAEGWVGEDAGVVRFTPAADNGLIYLIDGNRFLVAMDAENGEERWRFNVIKASEFAVGKESIFVAGYDGSVLAIKKGSGEAIWRRKVSQGIPVSAVIADKYLIVASNYKNETFLSTSTGSYVDMFTTGKGEKIWSENIDSTTSTSVVTAYNHLFLVTDNGYLRIYKSVNSKQ